MAQGPKGILILKARMTMLLGGAMEETLLEAHVMPVDREALERSPLTFGQRGPHAGSSSLEVRKRVVRPWAGTWFCEPSREG